MGRLGTFKNLLIRVFFHIILLSLNILIKLFVLRLIVHLYAVVRNYKEKLCTIYLLSPNGSTLQKYSSL